jgi:hypothetical protein
VRTGEFNDPASEEFLVARWRSVATRSCGRISQRSNPIVDPALETTER